MTNRLKNPTSYLKKLDIFEYFDYILYAGLLQSRKPSPEFFQKAQKWVHQRLDIHVKDQPIYIGDSWFFDVTGALNAGWIPVYMDYNNYYQTAPKKWAPAVIVSSFKQLKQRWQSYYLF